MHTLRAETELAYHGQDFFLARSARHTYTRTIPFLLFINKFGVHHNMYNACKGFYIIPAGLSYSERRQVRNLFTLTLGPHGTSTANVISSFQESLDKLYHDMSMSINGITTIVSAYIMAFTGDMPQQAKNNSALAQNAIIGCQSCYYPSD